MQKNACINENGATTAIEEEFPSVQIAVEALVTNNRLDSLAAIARKRLERLASQPYGQRLRGLKDPAELVNQAVELVLSGKRKARAQNLSSFAAFLNYMQGVLQSVITHELERVVRQGETVPADGAVSDSPALVRQLEAPNNVVKEVILNESEAALRARLEEYADQQADIDALLEHHSGPQSGPRVVSEAESPRRIAKRIHRLRKKARKILLQQAIEAGIQFPTPSDAVNL